MKSYYLILSTLLCLALCGCGTLHHDFMRTATDADSALITIADTGYCRNGFGMTMREVFVISHINGKPVDEILTRIFGAEQQKGISTVRLKPGFYTLNLHYFCWGTFADPVIWLEALPGASYIIRYDSSGYGIKAWAEDAATGRLVGGHGGAPESLSTSSPTQHIPQQDTRSLAGEQSTTRRPSENSTTDPDFATKLRTLKEMLNSGLITQEEFDSKKQSLIDAY